MATVLSNSVTHKNTKDFELSALQKEAKQNSNDPYGNECVVVSEENMKEPNLVYVEKGTFTKNGDYKAPTGFAYDPVEVKTSGGGGAQTATPVITNTGTGEQGDNVQISCATEGATIHYTDDGTTPTLESDEFVPGTTEVTIPDYSENDFVVKAIAVKLGLATSEVAEKVYSAQPVPPGESLYYCGWLVAETDAALEGITGAQIKALGSLISGVAEGADSPSPLIYVATDAEDPGKTPDIAGARMVYAYPKEFGEVNYFTDGLGKHAIADSYTKFETTVDGVDYYAYALTDVIAPESGAEYPQVFTQE